jgi:hypothetical protein
LFRCIHTTSLEQQQQQQQQQPSAHNFVDVILFRSVGCCLLDFLYNSIINRLIDRIWFFWIHKKRKKKKKKQQQQTIRKLSESKEAESIRFEKCLKLLPFLVSASADISHTNWTEQQQQLG